MLQPEQLEELVGPGCRGGAAATLDAGDEAQELPAGEDLVECCLLQGHADAGLNPLPLAGHVVTQHPDRARRAGRQPDHDPHCRRVAGPVAPEQGEDPARRSPQVDASECIGPVGVSLVQTDDLCCQRRAARVLPRPADDLDRRDGAIRDRADHVPDLVGGG